MYSVGNPDETQTLIGLDVVTAFVLPHGRIDWPETWAQGAHSAPGVFTTRADAEAAACTLFQPGSMFRIREVPAIRVKSYAFTYLVCDYLQPVPFDGIDIRSLKRHLNLGTPLEVVLEALQPNGITWRSLPQPNGVVATRLAGDLGATLAIGQRLGEWNSLVIGAPFELVWIREDSASDRRRVRAIEQAFQRVNDGEPLFDGDEVYARSRLDPDDPLAAEVARGIAEIEAFSRRVWELNTGDDAP